MLPFARLAILLLGAVAIGATVVPARAEWMPGGWPGRLLRWPLALLLGAGTSSLLGVAIILAVGPSTVAFVIKDLLLSLAALAVAIRRRRAQTPAPMAAVDRLTRIQSLAAGASLVTLFFASWDWGKEALRDMPDGNWDAWAIWNARARFIVRIGKAWPRTEELLRFQSHPDYPLLLPSLIVQGWSALGNESIWVPVAIAALFALAIFLALVAASAESSFVVAALAGAALIGAPHFAPLMANQYADLEVAACVLCGGILAARALSGSQTKFAPLFLSGAAFSMAASSKNEGALHLGSFLAAMMICSTQPLRERIRQLVAFCAGAASALCLLAIFKRMTPANDLVQGTSPTALIDRLMTFARWKVVFTHIPDGWRPLGPFGPLAITALCLWGIACLRRRAVPSVAKICGLAVVFAQLGFVFVFLTTPQDIRWHMDTAYGRLLMQSWPLAIFSIVLAYGGAWKTTEPFPVGESSSLRSRAQRWVLACTLLAIMTVVIWLGLLGRMPLTFDESMNYERISRNGFQFVLTHFIAPNNHRLFSFLQAGIPQRWIAQQPTSLRIVNVLMVAIFCFVAVRPILLAGWSRSWASLWLLAVVLSAPVFTLYLVIARGYLLGTTLLLAGAIAAVELPAVSGLLIMGALTGLATATVPSFLCAFPGLWLLLFARLWKGQGPRRALIAGFFAVLFHVAIGLSIYGPVLNELRQNMRALRPNTNSQTFLRETFPIGNSLILSAAIFAALGVVCWSVHRARRSAEIAGTPSVQRDEQSIALANNLLAACGSYVLIFFVAVAAHVTDSPFARNGLFIAPFVTLAIVLLMKTDGRVARWGIMALMALNIACGAALIWAAAVTPGDANGYPGVRELMPSAASRASDLAERIGPLDALETLPFWGSTPAEPYAEQLHLEQRPLGSTDKMPCAEGHNRPVAGQEVVAVKGTDRYLLCF